MRLHGEAYRALGHGKWGNGDAKSPSRGRAFRDEGVAVPMGGGAIFALATRRRAGTFARMLLTCQSGFETLLGRELADAGAPAVEQGPGWVRTDVAVATEGLAFPWLTLRDPLEVKGESVNALATRVAEFFLASLRGERIEAAWPSVWLGPQETVGLGRRLSAVESAFGELLKKKLSRVAKLAVADVPRGVSPDGHVAYVAREAFVHGQRRMADDDLAPSRSYLKIEEAYIILGREPGEGECVCDLGAAPGGWSYSAAKRGARVVAIDNGPLKGGALDHPRIEHLCADAFKFIPRVGENFDWLFCDLVEEPHHVLQHIVTPWLAQGWCRRFVINFKIGRVDAVALLRELRAPDSPFAKHAPGFRIRHLYHDREEFTVVGEVTGR